MTALEKAALTWWKSKRPLDWTKADHLHAPDINCRNDAEDRLAGAVAKMVEKK